MMISTYLMNNKDKKLSFKLSNLLATVIIITLFVGAKSQALSTLTLFLVSVFAVSFGKKIQITEKSLIFLGFFVLSFLIGLANSSDLRLWSEELFRNATLFLLTLVVVRYIRQEGKELFFDILYFSLFISILAYPFLLLDGRFSSYFSHPNHVAYLSLLVLYEMLSRNKFVHLKNLKVTSLVLIIFLTASSGGILCLTLMFFIYFSSKGTKYLLAFLFAILFLYLTKGSFEALNLITEKFTSLDLSQIENKINHLNFGNDTSLIWRITYWGALLHQYVDFDAIKKIFGLGYGTMGYGNFAYSWMITDPHNDYVRKLLETGFVGLTIFLLLWIKIFRSSNIGVYCIPIFFMPLLVGNIVVNIPFMISLIVLIYSYENK